MDSNFWFDGCRRHLVARDLAGRGKTLRRDCSRGDPSARDVDQEELRRQRDAFTSTPAGGGRADQFEQFAPVAALIDFAHDALRCLGSGFREGRNFTTSTQIGKVNRERGGRSERNML